MRAVLGEVRTCEWRNPRHCGPPERQLHRFRSLAAICGGWVRADHADVNFGRWRHFQALAQALPRADKVVAIKAIHDHRGWLMSGYTPWLVVRETAAELSCELHV